MKPTKWKRLAQLAAGVVMALGLSGAAFGQESLEDRLQRLEKQNEDIRKNAEVLQKQNEALLKLLGEGSPGQVSTSASAPLAADEVRNLVNTYLQEKDAKDKSAPAGSTTSDGRYKIGSDLRMSATWKNGFVVETPNKDFSLHLGGWVQYDNVWWYNSKALNAPRSGTTSGPAQGVLSGPNLGGIGSLEDGTYFRRIRLQTDGKFWENFEYTLTLALENDQFSTVGLDEFWVGMTNLPLIGTVRFGHVKNAIGIEGDMASSSKVMTFLERSPYSESIERNENFVTGMWLGNNYFDQRATWSSVLFRPDNGASSGTFFGNSQYGAQGRLTALPLYECEGRQLLHLGVSGGWRSGIGTSPNRIVQLRARPEMRDDDPAGSPAGGQPVPNADSNRLIDTGAILCNNDFLAGTELLLIMGPFSLQAEYGWNFLQNATGAANAVPGTVLLKSPTDYTFSGGYVQLAYTLTGENRSYDKRLGRLDSYYFGRKGNINNFWFVRDEDGRLNWNMGAWELAVRYGYVNLNDGTGVNRIEGGRLNSLDFALNWYLNDNMKFQLQYIFDHRDDLPTGVNPGQTRGLGMRMQFNY